MKTSAQAVLAVLSAALLLSSCITPAPTPPPLPSSFLEHPTPADGATGVAQPVQLAWTYVGTNYIAQPAMDVLCNGRVLVENLMACTVALPTQPAGAKVNWQVLAYTDAGVVTGKLWTFTTAATPAPTPGPVPPPTPPPPPVPTPGPVSKVRCALFMEGSGMPSQEVCNGGWTSSMSWRYVHGKSYENAYYEAILAKLKAVKANTLFELRDGSNRGNVVLDMCQQDREHPTDFHHMGPPEGWYDRMQAAGINTIICGYRDSPDSTLPISKATVQEQVDSFKGSRFNRIHLTGLETKRNTSIDQTVQIVNWFRELDPTHEVWVGDQSMDFLLAVVAKCKPAKIWLEQPTHPVNDPLALVRFALPKRMGLAYRTAPTQPLTSAATTAAYKAELARGAAVVGAGNVVAGEWLAKDKARRIQLTHEFEALGYVCAGGGDWSDR